MSRSAAAQSNYRLDSEQDFPAAHGFGHSNSNRNNFKMEKESYKDEFPTLGKVNKQARLAQEAQI